MGLPAGLSGERILSMREVRGKRDIVSVIRLMGLIGRIRYGLTITDTVVSLPLAEILSSHWRRKVWPKQLTRLVDIFPPSGFPTPGGRRQGRSVLLIWQEYWDRFLRKEFQGFFSGFVDILDSILPIMEKVGMWTENGGHSKQI